jgi:hypothetical protein
VTVSSEAITLGAQTSAEDDKTMKHVVDLRGLLASCCTGPYSADVAEFALILRLGGDLNDFDFEGCERIRRSRKERYITVDIGFPSRCWKHATDTAIRHFLADAVETGLLCCVQRLEKDRTPVDVSRLMADYAVAKQGFLDSDQRRENLVL